jgi:hypothetical protein
MQRRFLGQPASQSVSLPETSISGKERKKKKKKKKQQPQILNITNAHALSQFLSANMFVKSDQSPKSEPVGGWDLSGDGN